MVEHFADGDMFDSTLEPGWAPLTACGLCPMGTASHQGLPRHAPGPNPCAKCDRCSPRSATTTNSTYPPARLLGAIMKVATLMTT